MKRSQVVDLVARKLVPFVLLFGLYLISFGHLSPGGGFQGGVVLSSAPLLLLLARGSRATARYFPPAAVVIVEVAAFGGFLLVGLLALGLGLPFLSNFLPTGRVGAVPSAGMVFVLNMIIGLEVGAGVTLIMMRFMDES